MDLMKTLVKWNKNNCLQFLRDFDAFEHKYLCLRFLLEPEYFIDNNGFNNDILRSKSFDRKIVHKMVNKWKKPKLATWNEILNAQSHGTANHNLSYADEASAAMGIAQVYRDEGGYTNEYIEMLNLVRDRMIYDYTGINGLCDFFAPAYFNYEWGMHLEYDYLKQNSRYYRDHYVHQIRNLFEMFTLLDEFGYYKKIRDVFSSPESRVGTYIYEAIEQELLFLTDTDRQYYRKILDLNDFDKVGYCCIQTEEYHLGMRELMFHYVIYTATIVASLVHDIGYPISYIRRISSGISKNLPICQLLTSVSGDYASIEQALQTSLLFNIVSHERIRQRLDSTEEHGAQSAIVLLMYFCQHGEELSILQRCAINVAALMIYNHTNKYKVIGDKKEIDLIRSDVYKEPLSHLFRMCDDLQEWDRVYFEVTDQNNMRICPRCGTPVTRLFETDITAPEEKKYFCCCRPNKDGMFDTSWFVSRRIINVIACDEMTVESIEDKNGKNVSLGTRFNLDYDCGALLNIMMFNATFAKYRAKCVKQLKILHAYQGMTDTVLFDAFIPGNPLTVKIKILQEFGVSKVIRLFNAIDKPRKTSLLHTTKCVYREWRKNIAFYLILNELGRDFKRICAEIIKNLPGIKDTIERELGSDYVRELKLNKSECLEIIDSALEKAGKKSISNDVLKTVREYIAEEITEKRKNTADELADLINMFDALGCNTTNSTVLEDYDRLYKKLINLFKIAAEKYLKERFGEAIIKGMDCQSYKFSDMLENEPLMRLAVDHLIQQVNSIGFDKMKEYIEGANAKPGLVSDDIRLTNLYRKLYENLYCMTDDLRIGVDKYISRSDYEDIKKNCLCYYTITDRIDFFVDYGLFIKLWNTVKESKRFYFSDVIKNKKAEKAESMFDQRSHRRLGDPEKELFVLECITPESEFNNEYRFIVRRKNEETWKDDSGVLVLSINDGVGKLVPNDKQLRGLLNPIIEHHRIRWND